MKKSFYVLFALISSVVSAQGVGARLEPDYDDGTWQNKTSGNIAIVLTLLGFVAPYFIAKKGSDSDNDFAGKYWKWWALITIPSVMTVSFTKNVEDGLVVGVLITIVGFFVENKTKEDTQG